MSHATGTSVAPRCSSNPGRGHVADAKPQGCERSVPAPVAQRVRPTSPSTRPPADSHGEDTAPSASPRGTCPRQAMCPPGAEAIHGDKAQTGRSTAPRFTIRDLQSTQAKASGRRSRVSTGDRHGDTGTPLRPHTAGASGHADPRDVLPSSGTPSSEQSLVCGHATAEGCPAAALWVLCSRRDQVLKGRALRVRTRQEGLLTTAPPPPAPVRSPRGSLRLGHLQNAGEEVRRWLHPQFPSGCTDDHWVWGAS